MKATGGCVGFFLITFLFTYFVCTYNICMYACCSLCMEIREQFVGVGSLLHYVGTRD